MQFLFMAANVMPNYKKMDALLVSLYSTPNIKSPITDYDPKTKNVTVFVHAASLREPIKDARGAHTIYTLNANLDYLTELSWRDDIDFIKASQKLKMH